MTVCHTRNSRHASSAHGCMPLAVSPATAHARVRVDIQFIAYARRAVCAARIPVHDVLVWQRIGASCAATVRISECRQCKRQRRATS